MSSRRYRGWGTWYPPTSPRGVKGGIKAKNRRGAFAETWWGKRWIKTLESFQIGARLTRGRTYARQGQVLKIDVSNGIVLAEVQGSRSRPYRVKILFEHWDEQTGNLVARTITSQAGLCAGLLGGEMPADLEGILMEQGIKLFPGAYKDISTSCSCPDWSNPCKHIAAVAYLLASEFDRDPFLILELRGFNRDELLSRLKSLHGDTESPACSSAEGIEEAQKKAIISMFEGTEQGRPDVRKFWEPAGLPEPPEGMSSPPPVSASITKRLGRPPFWRSEQDFQQLMNTIYPAFSSWAEEWLTGFKTPDKKS